MEYISHTDYKNLMSKFQAETPKGLLKESLDPVGKEDDDIDNDGDVDKTDKYLHKRRQAVGRAMKEGEEDLTADDIRDAIDSLDLEWKDQAKVVKALDHVDISKYKGMTAKQAAEEIKDATLDEVMYGDSDGDFDAQEDDKQMANYYYDKGMEAYEDGDFLKADKYYTAALRLGSYLGWTEVDLPPYEGPATDYSRRRASEMEEMFDKDKLKKGLKNFGRNVKSVGSSMLGTPTYDHTDDETGEWKKDKLGKDYDMYDYSNKQGADIDEVEEGLNFPTKQATGQTIITNEDQAPFGLEVLSPDEQKQLKEYINSYKTIKEEISKLLGKAGKGKMMEAIDGENKRVVSVGPKNSKFVEKMKSAIDNHFESYLNSYMSYDILIHMLKKIVGTLAKSSGEMMEAIPNKRRDHDEKVPAASKPKYHEPTKKPKPGGDRTDLVMTQREMWENEEHEGGKHEEIEKQLNPKLHDALHKVKNMIIKDLVADGFTESEALMFLQHEMEEKGMEAVMGQHDPY